MRGAGETSPSTATLEARELGVPLEERDAYDLTTPRDGRWRPPRGRHARGRRGPAPRRAGGPGRGVARVTARRATRDPPPRGAGPRPTGRRWRGRRRRAPRRRGERRQDAPRRGVEGGGEGRDRSSMRRAPDPELLGARRGHVDQVQRGAALQALGEDRAASTAAAVASAVTLSVRSRTTTWCALGSSVRVTGRASASTTALRRPAQGAVARVAGRERPEPQEQRERRGQEESGSRTHGSGDATRSVQAHSAPRSARARRRIQVIGRQPARRARRGRTRARRR